ncbi:hypothetical protein R5R35_006987 [Gryllus longicercus]|uniref:RanBP2-type domain-containing protein n=1 Tax=Gryllus longicercus TaxID=2509291 RepID=A0AAN9WLX1_9ORTH
MNDYMHRDHLRDLWLQIDKLHLSYLQTDENLYKIEQKHKLESYIREYLCLAPHNRKFCFQETANVLHQSATSKETFSAYRAASAWDALGTYAANLLSQPWRKEYRVLKMYCGFYKHEIEANLVGAEVMLEAMGYKHTGNTTMVLEGPIDPDRVSNVSRDSLMASVECQLLKVIWEEVSRRFQCHWLDVLEFRENHICSPENAVKGLMYQFHQREYQEQHQHQMAMYHHQIPTTDTYGTSRFHHPGQACLYGQISPTVATVPHMGYYNYSPYAMGAPHPYTLQSQPRYGSIISPQQPMMSCPMPAPAHPHYFPAPMQPVLKSQEVYPPNGHATMEQFQTPVPVPPQPPVPTQAVQMSLQNGYALQSQINPVQATGQNYGCLVPTAQLIELDAVPAGNNDMQQTHSATDSSSSVLIPRTIRQHQNHQSKKVHDKQDVYAKHAENPPVSNYLSDSSKTEQTSRRSKDEGTGTFESWDYVFRNLESQGYNKDLGERPDILSPVDNANANSKNIGDRGFRNKETEALDLEDTLMEMRLEEMQRKMKGEPSEHRTLKINEALQKMKLDTDTDIMRTKHQITSEPVGSSVSVYDNLSSPPKEISSVQRPRISAADTAKSTSIATKTSTKTLPREPKKHENKRLTNNPHFTSATLDPRQLTERNNLGLSSTNAAEKSDGLGHEKTVRRNSVHKNRNCDSEKLEGSEEIAKFDDKNIGKWECVTCTYHNDAARDICEMCGKSKVRGSEARPLASGGRECPQCTLVNEKDVGTCVACDCSLKDSPTYI